MSCKIVPALALLLVAGVASATDITSSYTFEASGTNTGGATVDAKAQLTLDFTNFTLTLTLTNLLSNPNSVGQNITDFDFQLLSSGQTINPGGTAANCLTSAVAPSTVSVAKGGGYTVHNTPVDPQWAFSLNSGVFTLDGLAGGHNPAYSIIGPPGGATYSNAKGSIAGNGPHNPFINQTATWTFNIPNLATGVTPGHVVFSFNTTSGDLFSCDSDPMHCESVPPSSVPEPSALVLIGSGLIGIGFLRKRQRRS